MDRNYRLKLENKIENHILNEYIIASCMIPIDKKISKAAYQRAKWKDSSFGLIDADGIIKNAANAERDDKLAKLIEYRKPFISVLAKKYCMSIEEIKSYLLTVREKDIPTKRMIEAIRDMIVANDYKLENVVLD